MSLHWAFGVLLVACALGCAAASNCAPPNQCADKENCLELGFEWKYRKGLCCLGSEVCCRKLKETNGAAKRVKETEPIQQIASCLPPNQCVADGNCLQGTLAKCPNSQTCCSKVKVQLGETTDRAIDPSPKPNQPDVNNSCPPPKRCTAREDCLHEPFTYRIGVLTPQCPNSQVCCSRFKEIEPSQPIAACLPPNQCVAEGNCSHLPFTYRIGVRTPQCPNSQVCCSRVREQLIETTDIKKTIVPSPGHEILKPNQPDVNTSCPLPNKCTAREDCLHEPFTYRSGLAPQCPNSQVCCSRVKENINAVSKGTDGRTERLCGTSNPNGLQPWRRTSANEAKPGEFPWVVAIFHRGAYLGGGSLVAPGTVLTAAHLVDDKTPSDIVVRAGDYDFISTTEVARVKIHDQFEYKSGSNNLALLFLDSPFQLQDHIQTICLPGPMDAFDRNRCLVAGWGLRTVNDSNISNVLTKVNLPLVHSNTCQTQLRKTHLGANFNLHPSLICAGGEKDVDACIGDGGSALFCALRENPERYEQVGIVSWGVECGLENVPATYTTVAMFREWINQQLRNDRP